jgi:hypothetical protein
MQEIMDDIRAKTKEINALKKSMVDQLKPNFQAVFMPFLNKYPAVKRLTWRQYTPYFNDGEPCEFSVNDLEFFLGTDNEDTYEGSLPLGDYYFNDYKKPGNNAWVDKTVDGLIATLGSIEAVREASEAAQALRKEFAAFPEDVMHELFGDHAEITVTREGLEVEEYEHD